VRHFIFRRFMNVAMTALCGVALVMAFIPLTSVLYLVISKGAAGLSWDFFTALPKPVGEPGGGIGNALLGTLYMVALACLMGLPVGVGAGVFLAERGDGTVGRTVRFIAEVLSGVPSIVIGIVAYAMVVIPMHHFSALAGSVALAIMIVPYLAVSSEELIRVVPGSLREASLALGVTNWRTSFLVILRTAMAGIVTACLLAVARVAGETAPLLFTALNNQYWNLSPNQPTASLTVAIYNYAISPYEDWHAKAWTAALVLLMLVGVLNIASRVLTRNRLKGAR
jgi:phosphate transport system permease protein